MKNESTKQSTLIRGFMLLETIMKADKPLTSAYLAEDLDMPKATVHRISQQLEEEGFLQREPDGKRFIGGQRLRYFATKVLSNSVMSASRHMILQNLSDDINETVNLTALDGNEIIYLDRIESNWPFRIYLPVGSHLPLYCTATGKLFLANMNPSWQQRYLKAISLTRHTQNTITDISDLRKQLKQISHENVGYDVGEYIDGMIAVSVPVKNKEGDVCFAIAVHAPSARTNIASLKAFIPALNKAADILAENELADK